MCVKPIVIKPGNTLLGGPVPCGQCIECRLKRSREWALRCMHEASLYPAGSSFVTLTFSDEYLAPGGRLDREDFVKFMKRVRKRFGPTRHFAAGEYGEDNGRPHYHALLFGLVFPDRVDWSSRKGIPVFRSGILEDLWPFGRSEIGSVTFESAQYVAKYCLKDTDGSISLKSRGLGRGWLEKFRGEVYRDDGVLRDGVLITPPRFYDKKESELDLARLEVVKARRARKYGERCSYKNGKEMWQQRAARELLAKANLERLEAMK